MSRQSKKVNKRRKDKKLGTDKTTPRHGKNNRWPYDKSAPQRKARGDA